ncbi:MAG: gliding motility-associated C-terminal domain-containing protein [Bacteroidota bacterium]
MTTPLFSRFILLILLVGVTCQLQATHNRAGEITYEQIGDLTIRATITTYTRTSSFAADRDSLQMFWGDGSFDILLRANGDGEELPNDIKVNRYIGEHTYPTRGEFKLSTVDPNRVAGILNIDFPNSVNIQFYLETTFTLLDPRFQGENNSAILLQPPIDVACVNQPFVHNPNAYDPDGDSLAYELITPFQEEGVEVPNYQLPDQITPGPNNQINLDPITGEFLWESPPILGDFNITYRISEFRNGVLINTIIRDMQILVRACPDQNRPPIIDVPAEICVVAGQTVRLDILATDLDSFEILTITALGGPFEVEESAAMITVDNPLPTSEATAQFTWETICDHVQEEFYQVVIKVTDDLSRPMSGLATLQTIRIKVVAPPPIGISAEKVNDLVTISWDNPYTCDFARTFQGFSVWRREGSLDINQDTCLNGLEGRGYERVVFLTDETELDRYIAQDAELERGKILCYRVVAEFAQLTPSGNLFNRTASLPSEEVCIRTSGEEPLITNVTIDETDDTDGGLTLRWLGPDASLVDTTELVGPYSLDIYESAGIDGPETLIRSIQSLSFGSLTESVLVRSGLQTSLTPYDYRIEFISGTDQDAFVASSDPASSVFLTSQGSDQSIRLNWSERVPWDNFNYRISEVNPDGTIVMIDEATDGFYEVDGLVNGEEHCYIIESVGSYGLESVPDPLTNLSNESCATPRDDQAPCSPILTVNSICDNPAFQDPSRLVNTLTWSPCPDGDLDGYRIYYTPSIGSEEELIAELNASAVTFDHILDDNIAGCYTIASFDQGGNESERDIEICVDNCPNYELPNAFTPNDDDANDLFTPRVNLFIDRIQFEVFNRWGNKVWETTDPQINWDGTNLSDQELAEGTYYYICEVFESRVNGVIQRPDVLRGSIQLLR